LDDSVLGAVGGQPLPPAALNSSANKLPQIKPSLTSLKTSTKTTSLKIPLRNPEVPLNTKQTNKPLSNRSPKGAGDVIKLANKYSSLEEMEMDLGGAARTSPNRGKHK